MSNGSTARVVEQPHISSSALLDCTLRDGGYYTAWDFDDDTVDKYLHAMARLPIDVVELGYLNIPKKGYYGQYNFLTPTATSHARSILRADQDLAVMFDEKSVTPEDADVLLAGHEGQVSLVRIAVAPTRLPEALALASTIRSHGMRVGLNIMYLSKYWQAPTDLGDFGEIQQFVDSIALVDSYGSCTPEQVVTAVKLLREVVTEIPIGFHGHDNLGLALANSLAAAANGAQIIDGTVKGMGRGPGNTRTELLLVHKSSDDLTSLDHVALEAVMTPFDDLQRTYDWGTNLVYMISGAAGLPQNEVMDWLGKNRYSISAIVSALKGTLGEVDETVYPPLSTGLSGIEEVLIIGGGHTIKKHRDAVISMASRPGTIVAHANYQHLDLLPSVRTEQVVCVAGDAVARLPKSSILREATFVVVPEAPRYATALQDIHVEVRQVPPYASTARPDSLGPISDIGPLALALGAVVEIGARRVTLVGFDGYEHATAAEQELAEEVQALISAFRSERPEVTLTSATRTRYDIEVESIYSRLATR